MIRSNRPAICHPDRPGIKATRHGTRLLCKECRAFIKAEGKAICHRDRRVYRIEDGLCTECALDERARAKGIRRLGEWPGPVPGVVQYAYTEPPRACHKCGSTAALVLDGRRVHCAGVYGGCGADHYLVSLDAAAPQITTPQRYTAPASPGQGGPIL